MIPNGFIHTLQIALHAFVRANSSSTQWRYVSTKDNPADDASRGSSPCSFLKNERWKSGPEFLRKPEAEWPVLQTESLDGLSNNDPEVKHEVVSFNSDAKESKGMDLTKILWRFSSWLGVKKFVALCLRCQSRFRRNRCQTKVQKIPQRENESITVEEMKIAEDEI